MGRNNTITKQINIMKKIDLDFMAKLNIKLLQACEFGAIDELKEAIEAGANSNCRDGNATALHLACRYSHPDIVEYLIGAGVNVCVLDNRLCTPLHYACGVHAVDKHPKHNEIVEMILYVAPCVTKYVNMKNANYYTALDLAYENGYEEIATLLINVGAEATFNKYRFK